MLSDQPIIKVENLGKSYHQYDQPQDRLRQFLLPRLNRIIGRSAQNYFQEFWALQGVSFEVRRGETVGIIGRNGSGKSTLLQLICGTLTPTVGTVETSGRIAALLELGSGFNPEFTGRENVYMNGTILGLSRKEIDARFDRIAAFADIGDFVNQPVKMYSSGMLVRLAFAVIAHVDADILVIDEALAVGDAFFTQKCMRFLRTFMKTGTILFVSHDTASIKSLCSRAIWLEKGKMQTEGSPKEVCDSYLGAFFEAQQGPRSSIRAGSITDLARARSPKDQRLEFINASNLRNDLQVFCFDQQAASFGKGGAQIINVELYDPGGSPLAWVVGGEAITLSVTAVAYEDLLSPIIGFFVKDRLGQTIFGDNTYLSYCDSPQFAERGSLIEARFHFQMPIFPPGDYSIDVAIACGTQQDHILHHWIHDALMFRSEASSASTGLISVPMHNIELNVQTQLE